MFDSCFCWDLSDINIHRLTVFFFLSTEKPTLLKQVNAHDMQNQSQRGLMEGEENVRPILFSHFLVYYPRYGICPFLKHFYMTKKHELFIDFCFNHK